MPDQPLIVVALGGNAISTPDEEGTVGQQFAHSVQTARHLIDLLEAGNQLVVTHGNGPQIGNFMLRNEGAAGVIYPLPMEIAVAHVQGGMGFMIAQTLTNELARRGHPQVAIAFVTTVLVDAADPDFSNPSKPIGTVLNADEADSHREEGWHITEVAPGRFRRVVPSPTPIQIMEIESIRRAVEGGDLIIACGGGGIPVVREPDIGLRGTAAVIDKDLASALLATELDGDTLVFLSAVDCVAIDFGKPTQRNIKHMTMEDAQRWLDQGQFPVGSMGPKVQGALNFLHASSKPHARAIIGHLAYATDVLAGTTGTLIVKA